MCFWGGWGGSIHIMDLDRKVTLAYVMNKMYQDPGMMGGPRTEAYAREIYSALGHE